MCSHTGVVGLITLNIHNVQVLYALKHNLLTTGWTHSRISRTCVAPGDLYLRAQVSVEDFTPPGEPPPLTRPRGH